MVVGYVFEGCAEISNGIAGFLSSVWNLSSVWRKERWCHDKSANDSSETDSPSQVVVVRIGHLRVNDLL